MAAGIEPEKGEGSGSGAAGLLSDCPSKSIFSMLQHTNLRVCNDRKKKWVKDLC